MLYVLTTRDPINVLVKWDLQETGQLAMVCKLMKFQHCYEGEGVPIDLACEFISNDA